MAHERRALAARGAQIIGISADDADDSKTFARKYGIDFPLVADEDMALARQYVGVDHQGYANPGVVIVLRDGSIHTRQIAKNKHDRIYARRLLALLDGLPGAAKTKGPGLRGGYAAHTRRQVSVGLVGADARRRSRDSQWALAGGLEAAVLQPLSRAFAVGVGARVKLGQADRVDGALLLRVRKAAWGEQASLWAQLSVGGVVGLGETETHKRVGVLGGLAIGAQMAWSPGFATYVQAMADHARRGGTDGTETLQENTVSVSVGAAWLF